MNRNSWVGFQEWGNANAIGTASVKQKNRGIILKTLLTTGQQTRADLARKTKLSAPTISRLVAEMVTAGIVTETGIKQTGDVGAPGNMLAFNVNAGYVVGIDIGESVIQVALADLGSNVIDIENTSTKSRIGGECTITQLVNATKRLLNRNGVSEEILRCICVGVPGTVDIYEHGVLGVNAPDINGWMHYPLKDILVERIGINDVLVDNAQNLAVVSEHTSGCAAAYTEVVFIQIKGGIGAGILINGELYRGFSGKAGEIAFSMPNLNCTPPDSTYGNARHGAIEKEIGIMALLQKVGETLTNTSTEDLPGLEELYQRAADGDERLLTVIRESWDLLGMLVVNICSVLNPQIIVLGGDIQPLGDVLRDTILHYVQSYCLQPCEVKLSTQGAKACMIGAVQVACKHVHRKLGIR